MNRYYIVPIGTTVLCSTVVPTGTMVVPTGTMVLQGTTGYYGYYGTTNGYYTVPMGTMKYPKRGTMGTTSLSTQHKV